MPLKIHNSDIFSQKSGLIILPIDGISPNHEGTLGRNFIKLFPESWKSVSQKVNYPIPLGKIFCCECKEPDSFEFVALASMLNHTSSNAPSSYKSIVYEITKQTVSYTINNKIARVATPILSGGWRLNIDEAFLAMIDGYEKVRLSGKLLKLEIFELNEDKFNRIKNLANSMGFEFK